MIESILAWLAADRLAELKLWLAVVSQTGKSSPALLIRENDPKRRELIADVLLHVVLSAAKTTFPTEDFTNSLIVVQDYTSGRTINNTIHDLAKQKMSWTSPQRFTKIAYNFILIAEASVRKPRLECFELMPQGDMPAFQSEAFDTNLPAFVNELQAAFPMLKSEM